GLPLPQNDIERRPRRPIAEGRPRPAERDPVGVRRVELVAARNADDAQLFQGLDLARLADAVAVGVDPYRQSLQLVAVENAVSVGVEGLQRFIAIIPEHPEGDVAEPLQRRSDLALLVLVVHEDTGVLGEPGPLLLPPAAVGVEADA